MTKILFMTIPEELRKNLIYPESLQQHCKLLSLPDEILHGIIGHQVLSVFDRACLALTCKSFGSIIETHEGYLDMQKPIEGLNEDLLLDSLDREDAFFASEDPNFEPFEVTEDLRRRLRDKTSHHDVNDFYNRLNMGWNRSKSRFCFDCGRFRSTDREHWNKIDTSFTYRQTHVLARSWRAMQNCFCDCEPGFFIYQWGKHGPKPLAKKPSTGPLDGEFSCPFCCVVTEHFYERRDRRCACCDVSPERAMIGELDEEIWPLQPCECEK